MAMTPLAKIDLYDWALAHIQKAIVHSDLPDESSYQGIDRKILG